MHPVESLAILSREFSYKQVTVERVQLQTSNPVVSSATDKSLYSLHNVQLQVSHSEENSATKKSLYAEVCYIQVTM